MNNKKLNLILQNASDRLFPSKLGKAKVTIDSRSINGDTPLHVFIWGKQTENAIFLIENGADVNAIGDMGETPLHVAISKNNHDVIKALLCAGAKIDIVSEFKQTATDLAISKNIDLTKYT